MTATPKADGALERGEPGDTPNATVPPPGPPSSKAARILDEEKGGFLLEYDNTRGQKNTMRLYAVSYEGAVREAKSFLGIGADDRDEDRCAWSVE